MNFFKMLLLFFLCVSSLQTLSSDSTKPSSKECEGSVLSFIDSLNLTLRPYNCLKAEGIYTIELLIQQTETDLLRIPNFGEKSLAEVKARLAERGLQLSEVSKRFDIDRLNLSPEIRNTLVSARIDSVEKLPATIEELLKTQGLKEFFLLAKIKAHLEEEDILPDIERLGLSAQAKDPLVERGIVSIKKLTAHREHDLKIRVPNLREEGIQEIRRRLAANGLALRESHLHGTNVVYHVLGEVFPRLDRAHLYEGEDVVDWPSDWKQVLKETLPGIELCPFVPRSELSKLTSQEQEVLKLQFGFEGDRRHTPKEISQVLNLSYGRILEIRSQALARLRRMHNLSRALWLKSILPSNPDWTSHPEQVESVIRQFSPLELNRMLKELESLVQSDEPDQMPETGDNNHRSEEPESFPQSHDPDQLEEAKNNKGWRHILLSSWNFLFGNSNKQKP